MASPIQTPDSGNPLIDDLLWGWQWSDTNWTISFPQTLAEFPGYANIVGFVPFNVQQQNQIALQLSNVASFIPATFSLAGFGQDATFRHMQALEIDYPNGQGQHKPGGVGSAEAAVPDPYLIPNHAWGDIWYSINGGYQTPQNGNFANTAGLLHEFGHTLGLKHGHQGNQDVTPNRGTHDALPTAFDGQEFTVMTYAVYIGDNPLNRNEAEDLVTGTADYPWTFQMLDIQALQYMYGANFQANSGNTVMSWDAEGRYTIVSTFNNGVTETNVTTDPSTRSKIFMTIWDGGGFDRYDTRNFATNQVIDLEPGAWSTFSTAQLAQLGKTTFARGNIANALQYHNDPRSLIEAAWTGSGNDKISGNAGFNQLAGFDGRDTLDGRGGDDQLYGGRGNDQLIGNTGNDTLNGEDGNDNASGGPGNDSVDGGTGADLLGGGIGNDTLVGGDGNDNLAGGSGNDSINGGTGNDIAGGGDGADVMAGDAGSDRLFGGTGNDTLDGGSGLDVLFGATGADSLVGGTENDSLGGGQQNDVLSGGGGDDTLRGNAGNDTLSGGDGDDVIFGDEGADRADGGAGNDLFVMGVGNDVVILGDGNDTVNGGGGNDRLQAEIGGTNGVDRFNFAGGFGNDTITSAANGRGFDNVDIINIAGVNASHVTVSQVGANTLIAVDGPGADGNILLVGVSGFTVDDINFV